MKAANLFLFLKLKVLFPRIETLIHELVEHPGNLGGTFTASVCNIEINIIGNH